MTSSADTPSRHDLESFGGRLKTHFLYLFADHGIFRYFFNLPTPVDAQMYRSSQPSPAQIKKLAKKGFKTIINLRGAFDTSFYVLEKEACKEHGLTLVTLRARSRDVPTKEVIHEANALFASIEYPALLHCKSGADRAGLISALYLMLHKGVHVSEAKRQLSWRYGHWRQAKTGLLDHFLETYEAYDRETPTPFLTWVDEVYDPATLKSEFMDSFLPSLIVDKILRRE